MCNANANTRVGFLLLLHCVVSKTSQDLHLLLLWDQEVHVTLRNNTGTFRMFYKTLYPLFPWLPPPLSKPGWLVSTREPLIPS